MQPQNKHACIHVHTCRTQHRHAVQTRTDVPLLEIPTATGPLSLHNHRQQQSGPGSSLSHVGGRRANECDRRLLLRCTGGRCVSRGTDMSTVHRHFSLFNCSSLVLPVLSSLYCPHSSSLYCPHSSSLYCPPCTVLTRPPCTVLCSSAAGRSCITASLVLPVLSSVVVLLVGAVSRHHSSSLYCPL